MQLRAALLVCAVFFSAAPAKAAPVFYEEGKPARLSEWGMVTADGERLVLGARVVPYDLNMPLFTDYAHKLRTIWMPDGTSARYREKDVLDFPVGTVITKTFYYPVPARGGRGEVLRSKNVNAAPPRAFDGRRLNLKNIRLIETRLLIKRRSGWTALPYIWNKAQTEAHLQRIGDIVRLTLVDAEGKRDDETFPYLIPNTNQCAACHRVDHTARKIVPIGPKVRQLNRSYVYETGAENQLVYWAERGLLEGLPARASLPKNAAWGNPSASVEASARAYLDANCAHCHNVKGVADVSGLHLELETPPGAALGVCKLSIAAGSGTGGRRYGITPGAPDESILLYRMTINDPAAQMPEIGRATVHQEAAALIRRWIEAIKGSCE